MVPIGVGAGATGGGAGPYIHACVCHAALAMRDIGAAAAAIGSQIPDDLPEIMADPALLERILANLLSNAVRHSPRGVPSVLSASELDDRVEIRVVDHGPGIPASERETVFQPFQRLGDRDNETGVGLGLALSRGLAEAMSGTLEPHNNTPGGGLTMVVSLPIAADGEYIA